MGDKLTVNPWLTIWLEPKATIRALIKFNPRHRFILLSIVYGLPMVFNFAQSSSLIETLPLWAIVLGALVVCPFIGALGITISALLLTWTGKWIGGKGHFIPMRSAVAWASVPNAVTVALWCVLIGVFGNQVFSRGFADLPFIGFQAGVVFIVFLLESIASIWGFVILLHTVSEVQQFSVWKALLNVVIALVLVVGAVWVIGSIIQGSGGVVR